MTVMLTQSHPERSEGAGPETRKNEPETCPSRPPARSGVGVAGYERGAALPREVMATITMSTKSPTSTHTHHC